MSVIFKRISYHAVYDDSILDALKFAKNNGFKGIQVGIETPHLSFECLESQEIDSIIKWTSSISYFLSHI